jgi:hypothetical protein
MILPYLYVFLVFPVLVGILSVDIDGQPFSAIDYIEERLSRLDIEADEEVEEEVEKEILEDESFINNTNSFAYPEVIELPNDVSKGISSAWAYIWFLGSQSKDLGSWIGISTAPFHYVIAFAIAVFALFINQMMWIIAFFYLLITEFDEFKNIRKKDVI